MLPQNAPSPLPSPSTCTLKPACDNPSRSLSQEDPVPRQTLWGDPAMTFVASPGTRPNSSSKEGTVPILTPIPRRTFDEDDPYWDFPPLSRNSETPSPDPSAQSPKSTSTSDDQNNNPSALLPFLLTTRQPPRGSEITAIVLVNSNQGRSRFYHRLSR